MTLSVVTWATTSSSSCLTGTQTPEVTVVPTCPGVEFLLKIKKKPAKELCNVAEITHLLLLSCLVPQVP
jgi:hypothetical protein